MRNKTVADLFADFQSDCMAKKHSYEAACQKNAALAAVREQVKALALKKMECALSGTPAAEYDARLKRLADEEQEIRNGLRERRYLCARCKDTGMLGGAYCSCLKNRIYRDYYGALDISQPGPEFAAYDFSVFDDQTMLPGGKTQRQKMKLIVTAARDYIKDFPKTKKQNMLMYGKAGLGKTWLLRCMAKEAAQKNIDVLFLRANELFRAFFAHRMGEEADLSFLYGADLLLLDDIGTEPVTQNVSVEYFYELIAKRMELGRHTVFSTNIDDLQKRYDDRIASRLYSERDSIQLYLDGKDLRV